MTSPSTIGVVVAARDAAVTLDAALAGVAAQQWPADEVVVVDDGSSDDTAAVAERWRDRLPLRVIRQSAAGGPGPARNLGIAECATDLVAILDADDVWLPDHLDALVGRGGPGTVVSPTVCRWWPGVGLAPWTPPAALQAASQREQYERMLVENFVFSGSLVARHDVQRVGGFGPSSVSEDWDLWIRLASAGVRFVLAPGPTVLYRQHERSLSWDLRCLQGDMAVLQQVLGRERDERCVAVAERSLRDRRARLSVAEAVALAAQGRPVAARWRAASGLRGRRRTRILAAASMVAPASVERRRRAGVPEAWRHVGR